MDDLPDEILLNILKFSDAATVHELRQCSHTLKAAVDNIMALRKGRIKILLAGLVIRFDEIVTVLLEEIKTDLDSLESCINNVRLINFDWDFIYDQVPFCRQLRKNSTHTSSSCYNSQVCQALLLFRAVMAELFPIFSKLTPKIREYQATASARASNSDALVRRLRELFEMTLQYVRFRETKANGEYHPRRQLIAEALKLHQEADSLALEERSAIFEEQTRAKFADIKNRVGIRSKERRRLMKEAEKAYQRKRTRIDRELRSRQGRLSRSIFGGQR